MALLCPICGSVIPAKNINIQQTLALCAECSHVFDFKEDISSRKRKLRKLPPPKRLQIQDDETRLRLSYNLALGPGPTFGLVMSAIGLGILTTTFIGGLQTNPPFPVLFVLSLSICFFAYLVAVFVTTTTQIALDEDILEVRSGPLPFPFSNNVMVNTPEISRVFHKETVEILPMGMPAHHVYAELKDGQQIPLVRSLPRYYAFYIARVLDAYAQENASYAALPLSGRDFFDDTALNHEDGQFSTDQGHEHLSADGHDEISRSNAKGKF